MRRFHLFEIHDRRWCPASVRDASTDFLRLTAAAGRCYEPLLPRLAAALGRCGARRVVDLCSGAGGPWPAILRRGATPPPPPVLLTDLHPNRRAFAALDRRWPGRLAAVGEPVDATRVPSHLDGFRTLFCSFHHFPPDAARAVLRDAVRRGQGIAVLEPTERRWGALLFMVVMPLLLLLASPFLRPFRWSRLLWTYVLPLLPAVVFFDGIVSCLRTYTPDELLGMAGEVSPGYRWEAGSAPMPRLPLRVTYLIGTPPPAAAAAPVQ